jgi:uncharacterized membrane protein (DUF106 family)
VRRRRRIRRQQLSSRHRQVNLEQQASQEYRGKLQLWGNLEHLARLRAQQQPAQQVQLQLLRLVQPLPYQRLRNSLLVF